MLTALHYGLAFAIGAYLFHLGYPFYTHQYWVMVALILCLVITARLTA
jgi:hypothetical protein